MNLQRMRFAWARGARIQSQWNSINRNSAWLDTETVAEDCRIHPDDEHLQYGPLSSALRESVIKGVTGKAFTAACSAACAVFPGLTNEWWDLEGSDRRMQFLFLAELLADEGL